MENLWPNDIVETNITAPITILKKQASFLGEKTNNIVEAETEQIIDKYWMSEKGFAYSFYIVGKSINYKFNLFQFGHGVMMYPLTIKLDNDISKEIKEDQALEIKEDQLFDNMDILVVKSESEFLEALKKIFNSTKTRRIVQAILAQSEDKLF